MSGEPSHLPCHGGSVAKDIVARRSQSVPRTGVPFVLWNEKDYETVQPATGFMGMGCLKS